MLTKWSNVSMYAIVTLWFPFSPASSLAPGTKGRSIKNGTSNLLSFDPSSCRPISGRNAWALGLSLGSTLLQLNPDPSTNGSAPLGVTSQCETKAVLDFSNRPQDGGTIKTPPLSLPVLDAASYWLSVDFSNAPVYSTYWSRNRGALAWTKTSLRSNIPGSFELEFEAAGDIAFDFSLPPSTQPTTGEIAVLMIRKG